MKSNELVWRTIADFALNGELRWQNTADLAFEAGVPATTAHLALQKLFDIGAISRRKSGGFSTVNPEKVVRILSAWRNLEKDTLGFLPSQQAKELALAEPGLLVTGGPDAAIHYLGGNMVSDFSDTLAYLRTDKPGLRLASSGEVRVLKLDRRAAKLWGAVASPAQTLADLFAMEGWQASEFRYALEGEFIARRNWEREHS